MKKKWLCLGFVAVMAFSVAACSQKADNSSTESSQVSVDVKEDEVEDTSGREVTSVEKEDETSAETEKMDDDASLLNAESEYDAYKALLKEFLKTSVLNEIDYSYDTNDNACSFAVCDINSDGKDELLVKLSNSLAEYAFSYDATAKESKQILWTTDGCTIYNNGVVVDYLSHNQGYFGSKWPYMLNVAGEDGVYEEAASVDGYDKMWLEERWEGVDFPADIDKDNNGFVYEVSQGGESKLLDDSDYKKWFEEFTKPENVISPIWYETTEDNIEKISKDIEKTTDFKAFLAERTQNFTDDYVSEVFGPFCGSSYYLYDVNDDGLDDLIIEGALGLRDKCYTDIVINGSKDYQVLSFDGTLMGVKDNYLFFSDSDYEGAGEIRYEHDYLVQIPQLFPANYIFEMNQTREFSEDYEESTVTEENYKVGPLQVSKSEYEACKAKYSFVIDKMSRDFETFEIK